MLATTACGLRSEDAVAEARRLKFCGGGIAAGFARSVSLQFGCVYISGIRNADFAARVYIDFQKTDTGVFAFNGL